MPVLPPHRRVRDSIRLGAIAALALAGTVGCDASPRDPSRFLQPGDDTGQTGTNGNLNAIAGTWRVMIVVTLDTDLQSWVTTWRFDTGGTCRFQRDVTSIAEGVARRRERDCTWTVSGGTLTATFTDTGEIYPMPWSFRSFGTTTLILEGIEYQRVPG